MAFINNMLNNQTKVKGMKKKDFRARVSTICETVQKAEVESLDEQLWPFVREHKYDAVFAYAASCERFFEAMTRADYKRQTTFAGDLSIAEFCLPAQADALADTLKRCFEFAAHNVRYFGELVICLNVKAWEHNSRHNNKYCALYSILYHDALALFLDYYDGTPSKGDAVKFYYDYID